MGGPLIAFAIIAIVFLSFTFVMILVTRYKKCPSDKIMVIYGRTTGKQAARCIHGGAAFIFPVIQDYGYLSLRPMTIEVNLTNALCKQNIRISVPSVFTVGISTDPSIMGNAAERLFGLHPDVITDLAKDLIFGQLRLVIASMTIEDINANRETFLKNIEQNVADELNKLGLQLINVNITDIMDESGYINAIGKRAAAEAINEALVDVARADKKGKIGDATEKRDQRVVVAKANAEAVAGEAGAEKDKRIAIKQADAEAVNGENLSAIEIAKSNATRSEQEAEAYRRAEAANRVAKAQIEKAEYEAELEAQKSRAAMEREKQNADIIVSAEIQKKQIEIAAEAEAEKYRREARGEADAIFAKLDAEARGNFQILKAKGTGFLEIINSCKGDADAAAKMLLIEKLEEIVKLQTEAVKNIKIDKITVWDGGQKGSDGKTSTANFLSGMMQSLPPLHDVAGMAGIELPGYLGRLKENQNTSAPATPSKK
jgi:flotillin